MKKVELKVINITQGFTQHHPYAVVLEEVKGKRKLPIVIGPTEAQAIAVAIENITQTRPLTHDLFKNVLDVFHIFLSEIVITNIMDGIFYSKLICILNGEEYEIDSRTSDAIALAIRFDCPIYIYADVLDRAGIGNIIDMDTDEEQIAALEYAEPSSAVNTEKNDYSIYTQRELETLMQEALNEENYEKAATIRDELNKRENK